MHEIKAGPLYDPVRELTTGDLDRLGKKLDITKGKPDHILLGADLKTILPGHPILRYLDLNLNFFQEINKEIDTQEKYVTTVPDLVGALELAAAAKTTFSQIPEIPVDEFSYPRLVYVALRTIRTSRKIGGGVLQDVHKLYDHNMAALGANLSIIAPERAHEMGISGDEWNFGQDVFNRLGAEIESPKWLAKREAAIMALDLGAYLKILRPDRASDLSVGGHFWDDMRDLIHETRSSNNSYINTFHLARQIKNAKILATQENHPPLI